MSKIKIDYFATIQRLIDENADSYKFKEIPASARIEYIERHENVSLELVFSLDINEFGRMPDDEKKTKYLLQAFQTTHSESFLTHTDIIKDDLYRMKLREQLGNENPEGVVDDFIRKSQQYKAVLEITENMSEEEKYKYISTIDDKDIKTIFFYKTDDLTKRQMIIDSMEEDIASELQEPAKLAQQMIIDFFENSSNGQFTEKERQELEMVFRRTKVELDGKLKYLTNGVMRHTDYVMKMNPNLLEDDPRKMLLYFLHEYGHAISMKKFKAADYAISDILPVEEGMSDTFADIVAQSYSQKHRTVTLNGQNIDIVNTTIMNWSAYRNHNNLVRTMLYPLEQECTDKEAVFNYYFGNKSRFYELTLGEEYAQNLPSDFDINPVYPRFESNDIYENKKRNFRVFNKESVYAINNGELDYLCDIARKEIKRIKNY